MRDHNAWSTKEKDSKQVFFWKKSSFHSEIWGQFQQHFTSSFYSRRSQKRKKDSQVKQLLALLGSARVKAAHIHVDEIDPRG